MMCITRAYCAERYVLLLLFYHICTVVYIYIYIYIYIWPRLFQDIEHLAAEQVTTGTDEAQQIRKSMHVGTAAEEVSELLSDAIAASRASIGQVELISLVGTGMRSSTSAPSSTSNSHMAGYDVRSTV